MIRLFATTNGIIAERLGSWYRLDESAGFDAIFAADDPRACLERLIDAAATVSAPAGSQWLAPIQNQEVWAAGVTYLRSKTARMDEARDSGGGDFYDRVYDAERPELFFKATPQRVAGPGQRVRIRDDSVWNVPEPELTLAIASSGEIFGFSIGNDMSSRDIEGQNPLYLTQAKVYAGSAALGPCLVVAADLPGAETRIEITIERGGATEFAGSTDLGQMKRPLPLLADYLYRENSFPYGAYLMTGTGIVPPDSFTLEHGDEIRITIEPVGTLVNVVA
jgi:2-dehydro-3-deoxy-D-arabinonate dehydratase